MIDGSNETIFNSVISDINTFTQLDDKKMLSEQSEQSEQSEFISSKELIRELLNIAQHYGSLNTMCGKSLELKRQNQEGLYRVLDAAIALQVYIQALKNNYDQENIDLAFNLIKKSFTHLSEA